MLKKINLSQNLKAFILYTVLALLFTWPLLTHLTSHYPSTLLTEGGDPNMYIWVMDAVTHKIMDSSFHPSQMIFYPIGINFMAGYEAPIILPIGVPIILLTHNPVLAYNLILLLGLILTAYCCYLLILYLTNSYFAALIAGFSFGFSPYMMVRSVQHLDLLFLFTVPLVVLFALKSIENPTRKNLIFLVLSVILTALAAWYYLVGVLIFLLLLGLFKFKQFWQHKNKWFFTILAMGILLLLTALPMILNKSSANLSYTEILNKTGADPLNFFLPPSLIQSWTGQIYKTFTTTEISIFESSSYFGLVGLIAILVLILPKRFKIPNRGLWITVIIVLTLIAMGTHLVLKNFTMPMPFLFLHKFFPFDHLRAPNRFFVFAYLATTIVFGYFLADMQNRFGSRRIGWLLCTMLIIVLGSERLIVPYPLVSIPVPEFYKTLSSDPAQFAIADIPLVDPGRSLYNYYQLYHKKPIVDGEYFWTAYNDHTYDLIANNRLLDFAYSKPCLEVFPLRAGSVEKALKQLSDNNVRYVVVHNLLFQYDECSKVFAFVHEFFKGRKPIFSDGEITVYSTTAL